MGYDGKYGKITTEHGDIPDDEPVMLFRGRDAMLPALVDLYLGLCKHSGSPQRHLDIVQETSERLAEWQRTHRDRVVIPSSQGVAGQRYEQTLAEQLTQHEGTDG